MICFFLELLEVTEGLDFGWNELVEGVGVYRNAGMFVVLGFCLHVVVLHFDQVFRLAARRSSGRGESRGEILNGGRRRVIDDPVNET